MYTYRLITTSGHKACTISSASRALDSLASQEVIISIKETLKTSYPVSNNCVDVSIHTH